MASMTGWPTDGDDGSVATEARWRSMARLWAPDGVVAGYSGELAPTLAAGPIINVAAGAAWVDGHYAELASPAAEPVTADGMLVVRFTAASNLFELVYRNGVLYNALTQTDAVYEIPIARMVASVMTDWRGFTGGTKSSVGARFARSTNQSIANTTWTNLAGLTTIYNDDPGLFTWSSTNNWIQVTRSCVVDVTAGVVFDSNVTGTRLLRILRQSAAVMGAVFTAAAAGAIYLSASTGPFECNGGDTVEVEVHQNSGGALNLDAALMSPFMALTRVG